MKRIVIDKFEDFQVGDKIVNYGSYTASVERGKKPKNWALIGDAIVGVIVILGFLSTLTWAAWYLWTENKDSHMNVWQVPACSTDDYSTVYPCYREGRPNDENGKSIWLGDE